MTIYPILFSILFSAAIGLAGFLAVYLVFSWSTLDRYVDNRKSMLTFLLEPQIRNDPMLAVRIRDIGKQKDEENNSSFRQYENDAVDDFVADIILLRRIRGAVTIMGLSAIGAWMVLAFCYALCLQPCAASVYQALAIVGYILFAAALAFTFLVIYVNLTRRGLRRFFK